MVGKVAKGRGRMYTQPHDFLGPHFRVPYWFAMNGEGRDEEMERQSKVPLPPTFLTLHWNSHFQQIKKRLSILRIWLRDKSAVMGIECEW